jgi:hypothetical protein
MSSPTGDSGVEVTADIKDSPSDPSNDANDDDTMVHKQMHAYAAVAHLNCTSSLSGSPTKSVNEGDSAGNDIELSLSMPIIDLRDETGTTSGTAYGAASWTLTTTPATATLGTNGQLNVTIGENSSGTLYGGVWDSDLIDGSVNVSVGLTAGEGIAAGVTVTLTIGSDTSEGTSGSGFAFSSDLLGDDANDKLEMKSSSYGDPMWEIEHDSQAFGYSPSSVVFRGAKGASTTAKGVVSQKIRTTYDSNYVEASASSSGTITYSLGIPSYTPGTSPGPEDGYND